LGMKTCTKEHGTADSFEIAAVAPNDDYIVA